VLRRRRRRDRLSSTLPRNRHSLALVPELRPDPLKLAAVPVRVELDGGHVDLDALLAAVTPRTKLAFVPTVNNPTGTMTTRDDLLRFLDAVPEHVLTVVVEAYLEYVDDPGFPDAVEEGAKRGRRVLALRTFSKIYGLAGLRIGYGVGPAPVIAAMRKVQRAFDVTTPAQEAAIASLDGTRSSPAGAPSIVRRWRPSRRFSASAASPRSRPPPATSSSWTSARTLRRSIRHSSDEA
jgi:histidinol-phosphate/aromatic aminotransferase/cobyric acid decarboxylase-like protein